MNPSRIHLTAAAAALVALAAAATPALAIDRCVGTNGCAPADTFASNGAGLQAAIAGANTDGTGRVLIGPGVYVAPAGGFALTTAGGVELAGSGVGLTVIDGTGLSANSAALRVSGTSVAHDMTIRTSVATTRALQLVDTAQGRALRIEGSAAATNGAGAVLQGSGSTGPALINSTVVMAGTGTTAVAMNSASSLRSDNLSADKGVTSSVGGAGQAFASRVRVDARTAGVSTDVGTLQMSDSLITVTDPNATAVTAFNPVDGTVPVNVKLDRVTIAGTDGAGQTGVLSEANSNTGDNATVNLRNTIVAGVGIPLRRIADPAGLALITTGYTSHAAAGVVSTNNFQGAGAISETFPITAQAAFVNAAAGDYHLVPGSPLIDAADPSDGGQFDLSGGPRPLDGDGNGTVIGDLGAYESPAVVRPPVVSPVVPVTSVDHKRPKVTALKVAIIGHKARIKGRISEPGTLRVRIARKGVKASQLRVITLRKAGAFTAIIKLRDIGRYKITLVARDRAGNNSAPLNRTVRILPKK